MARFKTIRSAVTTILAGALIGYALAAFAEPLFQRAPVVGGVREPWEARAFLAAVHEREADSVLALQPRGGVVNRALVKKRIQGESGDVRISALSWLGGRTAGSTSVHLYVVEIRNSQGAVALRPYALTLANGKVVRVE